MTAINYQQAPSGATNLILLAADTVSSDYYQGLKIFDGTAGCVNPLVVDSTGRVGIKPSPELQVNVGNMFLTGTGVLTLSATGYVTALLSNPSTAAKNCRIWRCSVLASIGPAWASLFINPTTGLPTTLSTQNNLLIGSAVSSPVTFASGTSLTTALSGGTNTGVVIGVPNGVHVEYNFPPIVLPPNYSLGINLPFTGAATASMNIYYWLE